MKILSVLKKDMDFNKGLTSLIEVLKNIAVAQYHLLEQKIKSYEKFITTVEEFFELLDTSKVNHPFLQPREKKQAIVAVTSDSGMLGGLNMQVVSTALRELEKIPGKLIVIGERGKSYARESGVSFTAFSGIKDEERYSQAMQMRDFIMKEVLETRACYLQVVYPKPISFTVQRVEKVSFLPYVPSQQKRLPVEQLVDIIVESDVDNLVEYLLYLWMGEKLYEIFGLSRLAEFAARFVHLEESSQKLKDMNKKLQLEYFRVRHELIDRNMRELFSARLLYAHKH